MLLVGNPTAQSGKNAERIEEARRLLLAAGLAHDFVSTAPGGATVGKVAEALRTGRYHTAIYMGGDGTFAEVAKGIIASGRAEEVRLAMLPTGTANDQGKSFGLSSEESELPRNVEVIVAGRETRLDAGRLQGFDDAGVCVADDLFFDSAGWGISPRVLAVRNEDRKLISGVPVLRDLWRDQLVYVGALFRTFLASYVDDDKFDATVEADERTVLYPGLTDLIIKGTRIYGGAWVFDHESRPDDGKFEVVPFTGKRDWISKAIIHLDESGAVKEGLESMGLSHSEGLSARVIEVSLRPAAGGLPLKAQIDGEEFPATARARIEVLPRVLRLIVPERFATS